MNAVALALSVLASVPLGAPLDTAGFQYARTLTAAPPGLAAVRLDAAVLAHSAGLADLRIADGEGRQVPYLRVPDGEPLRLQLLPLSPLDDPAARRAPSPSRYRIVLPWATLPAARLVLATPERVFSRDVRLLRPLPPEGRRGRGGSGETLAVESWSHADPDAPAPELDLDLPAGAGAELELLVYDADNAPLPLASPRLEISTARLLFYVPAGAAGRKLRLLYGKPGLAEPRYDLTLLASRLEPATSRPVRLGEERTIGRTDRLWPSSGALFWSALVAATLALLLVLARLLRPAAQA